MVSKVIQESQDLEVSMDYLDFLGPVVCQDQKAKKVTLVWPKRKDILVTTGILDRMVSQECEVFLAEMGCLVYLAVVGFQEKVLLENLERRVFQAGPVDLV